MSKLKEALVRSYVGALGTGWVFAEGITYLVNALFAPLDGLITRYFYRHLSTDKCTDSASDFRFLDLVSPFAKSLGLLLLGYVLLRWLYFKPLQRESAKPTPPTPEPAE